MSLTTHCVDHMMIGVVMEEKVNTDLSKFSTEPHWGLAPNKDLFNFSSRPEKELRTEDMAGECTSVYLQKNQQKRKICIGSNTLLLVINFLC